MGLIETVCVRHRVAPLWRLHLERLHRSAEALGIAIPDGLVPPEGGDDRIVRFLLAPDGVSASARGCPVRAPVRVAVVAEPHQPYPFKTTERAAFERAAAEALELGADEPVLLARGRVAETARWGIYWWEGSRLCAPPLALGVLPSVARARIAELLPIEERAAPPGHVARHAAFLANAARGIVEVAAWNGDAMASSGLTAPLAAHFWP